MHSLLGLPTQHLIAGFDLSGDADVGRAPLFRFEGALQLFRYAGSPTRAPSTGLRVCTLRIL